MSTRRSNSNTLSWSLISSGLVTLLLFVIPGPSVMWGVLLILAGLAARRYA